MCSVHCGHCSHCNISCMSLDNFHCAPFTFSPSSAMAPISSMLPWANWGADPTSMAVLLDIIFFILATSTRWVTLEHELFIATSIFYVSFGYRKICLWWEWDNMNILSNFFTPNYKLTHSFLTAKHLFTWLNIKYLVEIINLGAINCPVGGNGFLK